MANSSRHEKCHSCFSRNLLKKNLHNSEKDVPTFSLENKMTLSNDIEEFLEQLIPKHVFIGCYPIDKVPIKNILEKKYCMCVINTDEADKPGQHFVCLIRDNSKLFLFDSTASSYNEKLIYDRIINKILREKSYFKIWKSKKPVQDMYSNTCGYFCIWFLLKFYFFRPATTQEVDKFFDNLLPAQDKPKNHNQIAKEILVNVERIIHKNYLTNLLKKHGMISHYDFNEFEKYTVYYQ